jgi:hypothetical protein
MQIEDSLARRRQAAKQRNFLNHFSNLGNVRDSAALAGVSRALVYYWREHSPTFAEKLSAAADEAFGGSERKPTQYSPTSAQRGPVRKRERMKP